MALTVGAILLDHSACIASSSTAASSSAHPLDSETKPMPPNQCSWLKNRKCFFPVEAFGEQRKR
jgi:hypothetical protein